MIHVSFINLQKAYDTVSLMKLLGINPTRIKY